MTLYPQVIWLSISPNILMDTEKKTTTSVMIYRVKARFSLLSEPLANNVELEIATETITVIKSYLMFIIL